MHIDSFRSISKFIYNIITARSKCVVDLAPNLVPVGMLEIQVLIIPGAPGMILTWISNIPTGTELGARSRDPNALITTGMEMGGCQEIWMMP